MPSDQIGSDRIWDDRVAAVQTNMSANRDSAPGGRRVAVVTGAARGLGRVIAVTLAEEGFDLALVDMADLEAVMADVEQRGANAWPRTMDVSAEPDVTALATDLLARFGRVDALINNAGISLLVPAESTKWTRRTRPAAPTPTRTYPIKYRWLASPPRLTWPKRWPSWPTHPGVASLRGGPAG